MAEGSYIPLTNEALEDFKEYLKKSVAYAEYRSGSTSVQNPDLQGRNATGRPRGYFCYVRPYRPESDYRNPILSQKRIHFRRRKRKS